MSVKVGWVGLGKLGLPCALVLAQHHEVTGYDVNPRALQILTGEAEPMQEEGIHEALTSRHELDLAVGVGAVVEHSEIIFVAVQTPHAREYGGEQPFPDTRRDFEYSYLVQAVRDICNEALLRRKHVVVAVVSTVLPGTTDRLIRPLLNKYVTLIYTPQFIAMGTTIRDFKDPEFVICGVQGGAEFDLPEVDLLRKVFEPVHGGDRLYVCDVPSAEAIKVFYNTFISMKLVFANMLMEVCHKTGADCDVVSEALGEATQRLLSPRYMRGGMGDGGACHPRDLIALSWLSQRLGLSYDLMGEMARAREAQTRWLAEEVGNLHRQCGLPVVILGRAYKPGSNLVDGSPALLLQHYLHTQERVITQSFDAHVGVNRSQVGPTYKALIVVAAQHPEYATLPFIKGSVVVDPFGFVQDQDGVTVVRVGRKT